MSKIVSTSKLLKQLRINAIIKKMTTFVACEAMSEIILAKPMISTLYWPCSN